MKVSEYPVARPSIDLIIFRSSSLSDITAINPSVDRSTFPPVNTIYGAVLMSDAPCSVINVRSSNVVILIVSEKVKFSMPKFTNKANDIRYGDSLSGTNVDTGMAFPLVMALTSIPNVSSIVSALMVR